MIDRAEKVARLRDMMLATSVEHERFVGAPVDIDGLTPRDLGSLWPLIAFAHRYWDERPLVRRVAQELRELMAGRIAPRLSVEDALAYLEQCVAHDANAAVFAVAYLDEPVDERLRAALLRCLDVFRKEGSWATPRCVTERRRLLVIARAVGGDIEARFRSEIAQALAHAPLTAAEFELIAGQPWAYLCMHAGAYDGFFWTGDTDSPYDGPTLGDDPAYREFARRAIGSVLDDLQALHAGARPYVADRGVHPDEVDAIRTAMAVTARHDESWAVAMFGRLMPLLCVAPTAAKTVPSQSLISAFSNTFVSWASPESIAVMREALAIVRNAAVKKRLGKSLDAMRKAMAARPDMALRLTEAPPDRGQQAMLTRFLESWYLQGRSLTAGEFRLRLADAPGGRGHATRLIWSAIASDGRRRSFTVAGEAGTSTLVDATGASVTLSDDADVTLWHPLGAAEDERQAWRDAMAVRSIVQPFRQAYREFYSPRGDDLGTSSSSLFDGFHVSLGPLLAVSRRTGWAIERDAGVCYQIGAYRTRWTLTGSLYPGADGLGETMALHFYALRERRWAPVNVEDVPPQLFSEISRMVDLMISVSTYAVYVPAESGPLTMANVSVAVDGVLYPATEPLPANDPRLLRQVRLKRLAATPLSQVAMMRRHALQLALSSLISAGRVTLDERHVRIGDHAIHLATAQVTRNGEAIDLVLPPRRVKLKAVPWLPYDEALLQRIVDQVGVLLAA